MARFDQKTWNDKVFQKYLQKVPNSKLNSMINSGVLKVNNSLKARLVDGVGGNLLIEPIKGLLDGQVVNYDGNTNITTTSRNTFSQRKIVVGRAKGWEEKDFSTDLTGENWMAGVAGEVAEYYEGVDQDDILAILKGIFAMSDTAGLAFAAAHTTDISAASTATVGATTLNSAIQKASGDRKAIFKLAFMHSYVATNLENLQLLEYLKYTDANGIQRDLGMATWNGRLVIIDDEIQPEEVVTTSPVYGLTISTAATAGDKIIIDGTEYTFVANNTSNPTATQIKVGASGTAAQQAANIATLLNAQESGLKDLFTITDSSSKVVFTAKAGTNPSIVGVEAEPVASTGTLVVTTSTDTAGVSAINYTTYVLGDGAIEYCNIGAKVPSEVTRDAATNGGVDKLYTRQRKLYAPKWISWKGADSIISPTNEQLATGSNWEIVNDGEISKTYVNHKFIPFVRIISRG
jgi:hypothetical protein